MTEVPANGKVPASWQITLFRMLPKTSAAKCVFDFRPIANEHLLYKLFAYLMLGRMETWTPPNNRRCGRPPFAWDEKVRAFFRWKQLGDWRETSTETWHRFESEFVAFITGR